MTASARFRSAALQPSAFRLPTSIAAAVVLAISVPVFAQEWTEFVSKDDRFMASFPGPPRVTATTYKSQFGADLPARVYSASLGPSRFSLTVVDYRPVEKILTEKAKSCPAGAETCIGGTNAGSSTDIIICMSLESTIVTNVHDAQLHIGPCS